MEREMELYLRLPYPTIVVPDETTDGVACFLAYHPDLPGCMSHGETTEEAVGSLDEARRLYLSALLKRGQMPPLPSAVTMPGNLCIDTLVWEVFPPEEEVVEEQEPWRYDANTRKLVTH